MKVFLYYLFSLFCLKCYAQQYNAQSLLLKIQDAVFTVYAELDNGVSQGSGFFISSDGIGITNYHVLDGANSAKIKLRNGEQYVISKILDYDADMDLVKFQVNNNGKSFKSLQIKPGAIQKGESILNLSSPIGLEQTLSTGIVSSLRRDDTHGDVIQITAPISHGSSGSPVLNMKGEVIGVATFGFEEGQSLNFAVSALQINLLRQNLNLPVSEMGRSPLETLNIRNARKFIQQGDYAKAVEYLDEEIRINPENHIALYLLSKVFYNTDPSNSNERLNAIDQSITFAAQAIQIEPDNSDYYSQLGMSVVALGIEDKWNDSFGFKIFEMAKQTFEISLRIDSLNINSLYGMAKLLCEASRYSPENSFTVEEKNTNYVIAISLLEIVNDILPSEGCYNYLCIAYTALKNFGMALIYCDKAITLYPNWYRGYYLRGDIKIFEMNMFNEGLLDLEKALALCESPHYAAEILSLRGTAYEQKAFAERKNMATLVAKAIDDYCSAYNLTKNPVYMEWKDKIVQRFNNAKVLEENF